MFLIDFIKERIWRRRLGAAIDTANEWHNRTGYRYYVINIGGRLRVVAKKDIKALIARRVGFRRGVKIADIEKRALYITPLGNVLSK